MTPEKRPAEEEGEETPQVKKHKEDPETCDDSKSEKECVKESSNRNVATDVPSVESVVEKLEESKDETHKEPENGKAGSEQLKESAKGDKKEKSKSVSQEDAVEANGDCSSEKAGTPIVEGSQDESSQDSIASSTASETKKKLDLPEDNGKLLYCGCCQWDLVGRRNQKAIPSMQHFVPRTLKSMADIMVSDIASHSSSTHGVIITAEGKAMTIGRNEKGQLGVGDTDTHPGPVIVDALKDLTIVGAATGRNHTLFLTDRGTVFACGDNKSGQCGIGNSSQQIVHTPCRINFKGSKIIKIACGAEFSMIVDNKGCLYSFGLPEYGQLGHNTDGKFFMTSNKISYQFETAPRRVPVFVERSKDGHPTPVTDVHIVDVACGNNHTIVLDSRRRVYTWGFGGYGRLGHSDPKDEMIPRLIKFFDGVNRGIKKVFCGATFTMGISDMGLYLWGQTKRTGEANMYPKPVQDLFGWDVRAIGCSMTSIVVSADSSVIAWGPSPTYGELGLGENTKSSTTPKEVKALEGAYITKVACSQGFTMMIAKLENDGDVKLVNGLKVIDI